MSAYSAGSPKQEMPPPGGYEEINFRRIPAQRIFGCKCKMRKKMKNKEIKFIFMNRQSIFHW